MADPDDDLTQDEIDAIEAALQAISLEEVEREIFTLSLADFVRGAWHVLEPNTPLQWNWHLDAACDHLQALVEDTPGPHGEPCPQNLLINIPPGTMKSLLMAVFLPAWVWIRRPSWRAIYASGTPSVVTRDSLKCRTLIKSDWYQTTFRPTWKIATDQDEKQHFANTAGGFRKGMGAGTSVTGERADFLGVDDPNDAKEVYSKAHRDAINDRWWDNAFHNRIADPSKSKRCVIMQRLHELDLAGYVLSKEGLTRDGGAWAHLCIRMEYETPRPEDVTRGDSPTWLGWKDPRTTEGALMFPERFTPAYLAGERTTLGSAGYAGQMQQRPVPAAGNRFQRSWWRFWSPTGEGARRESGWTQVPPVRFNPAVDKIDEMVGSWDCAFKDSDGSDYVVGIVVARAGACRYVVERYRQRASFGETVKAVTKQRRDWRRMTAVLVEDKANGTAVIDTLNTKITGLIPVEPKGGKEARAAVLEPCVEAGNWFLPEGAEWLGEWIEEFASFPLGRNDDQVDAASQVEVRFTENADVARARSLLGMR